MTESSTPLPASRSLLDMVERASLFALLQQALQYQKLPQMLPPALYGDLGIEPSDVRAADGRAIRTTP